MTISTKQIGNLDSSLLSIQYLPFNFGQVTASVARGFLVHQISSGGVAEANRLYKARYIEILSLSLHVGATISSTGSIKAGVYKNVYTNRHDDATTGTLIGETGTISNGASTFIIHKDIRKTVAYEDRIVGNAHQYNGSLLQVRLTITSSPTFNEVVAFVTYREVD